MIKVNVIVLLLAANVMSVASTLVYNYYKKRELIKFTAFNVFSLFLSTLITMPYFVGLLVLIKVIYNMI